MGPKKKLKSATSIKGKTSKTGKSKGSEGSKDTAVNADHIEINIPDSEPVAKEKKTWNPLSLFKRKKKTKPQTSLPDAAEHPKASIANSPKTSVADDPKPPIRIKPKTSSGIKPNASKAMKSKTSTGIKHKASIGNSPKTSIADAPTKASIAIKARPSIGIKARPSIGIKARPSIAIKAKPSIAIKAKPSISIKARPSIALAPNASIAAVPKASIAVPNASITNPPKASITNSPKTSIAPGPNASIAAVPKASIAVPNASITNPPKASITNSPKTSIAPGPKPSIAPGPKPSIAHGPKASPANSPKTSITPTPKTPTALRPRASIAAIPNATAPKSPKLERKHSTESILSRFSHAFGITNSTTSLHGGLAPTASRMSIISRFSQAIGFRPKASVANFGEDFVVPEGAEFTEAPPDTDPHKAKDPMNRNTWSVEAFHPTKDRRYQNKFLDCLMLYEWFATLMGKYPFSTFSRQDASLLYHINWHLPRAIWFVSVSVMNFILCSWILFGALMFITEGSVPTSETPGYWRYVRAHEMLLMRRNFATYTITLLTAVHVFIVHFLFIWKRGFLCRYYAYWVETIELLRLDCSRDVQETLKFRMGTYTGLTILLLGAFASETFQICQGCAATIGMLLIRPFSPGIVFSENYAVVRYFGAIVFIYLYMTAKFSAIYFAVRCRLLNNLIQVWNRRFRVCLLGAEEVKKKMMRSSRAYLFKDHCVWLNLLEGANHEFFLLLESFVVAVLASFVFEANHLVRAVSGSEFDNNRMMDFLPALLLLIIDVYYFYMVGIESGVLIDSVADAFDIIREKGVMTKSTDQELWFMMSMQLSLMGSTDEIGLGIVGWEFVYFSKTFMVVAFGLSFSFFVMYWQYQAPIDLTWANDNYCDRINVSEFLSRVENARIPFAGSATYLSACNSGY